MNNSGIRSVQDIKAFFRAFNDHDWETVFHYMSEDCVWDASEKRLTGKQQIIDYWTNYHTAIKETLGNPEHIILDNNMVYLQVSILLEFIEDGMFFGKSYKKGETFKLKCTDYYELNEKGLIQSGCVFVKLHNT